MASRVHHLVFRSVEEFFDRRNDPSCLTNLLAPDAKPSPDQSDSINRMRTQLRDWMVSVGHPGLDAFDRRSQEEALEGYIRSYRERAAKEVEALNPYEKAQGFRF